MPTYEYRCEKGHHFDVVQRMSDDPVAVCEVCGLPVQRVLHPVAVHFKGKGFYNTDYGTRNRQRENQANGESSGSSGSSDSSGKDKEKSSSDSASKDSSSSTPSTAEKKETKSDSAVTKVGPATKK
jgi:putative FmdB family regulatory protein